MGLNKAERKELRRQVRQHCAQLLAKAPHPGFELIGGMYQDEATNTQVMAIITAEKTAVCDRIDWGQWPKEAEPKS